MNAWQGRALSSSNPERRLKADPRHASFAPGPAALPNSLILGNVL